MSAIPRKTQLIFGGGLVPASNVANFGSLAAGTPTYSNDPAQIQTAAWLNGAVAALIGNRSLAWEDLNGILLVLSQQVAYLLQSGPPEWDVGTTYWTGNICRGVGTNVLYCSVTNGNINHAVTDTNNWIPYGNAIQGPGIAKAFAIFDGINTVGSNARLIDSFNVSSVLKNAAGSYTVNFANPLNSGNYVMTGSCGSEDGQPYGGGDDGVVVGNLAGQGNAIRSASACRLFTINPTSKALVQSGCVSVAFFGN